MLEDTVCTTSVCAVIVPTKRAFEPVISWVTPNEPVIKTEPLTSKVVVGDVLLIPTLSDACTNVKIELAERSP